jgi:hypothetical protein
MYVTSRLWPALARISQHQEAPVHEQQQAKPKVSKEYIDKKRAIEIGSRFDTASMTDLQQNSCNRYNSAFAATITGTCF